LKKAFFLTIKVLYTIEGKMATNKDIKNLKNVQDFSDKVKALYGDVNLSGQKSRYENLLKLHAEKFGGETIMFSSPGRIEVIGNHTDHNNGKVLTAAISVDTLAAVTKSDDGLIKISSCGYPMFKVDTNNTAFDESELGTSVALVKGLLSYFKKSGYNIGGFSATMVSDVFKGAGVSSSASFEVLVAEVLNKLYNDGAIPKMEKAKASQYAENKYFGKPCGLMDQSAISLGGISMIDFESTENPKVSSSNWPFSTLEIFVVNSGGAHSDLTDNYSAIRTEMESVAKFFGKKVLREVDEEEFYEFLPKLQNAVSGRAILRAMHYFDENNRVDAIERAIEKKDLTTFCDIVKASGESSYKLLQNCYPEGDKKQRVAFALAVSAKQKGVVATRVHGGGFMGTILTLVKKESANSYFDEMKLLFGEENIYRLSIRNSGAVKVEI
jgi:galactokinase